MRVHHLNCATMCPASARLVNGEGSLVASGRLVAHCLLVERADGLVLVDTGFGLDDVRHKWRRLGALVPLLRPRLDERETAIRQVEGLGFRAADVRHVVVTHLDPDHAGGLADFPSAEVHVLGAELDAARAPRTLAERARYRRIAWRHNPRWVRHAEGGERWLGFEAVRALEDDDALLMIPLAGHSRGHTGVAVRADAGWLLHCGDAYFFHGEVETPPRSTPGLRAIQFLDDADHDARRANQARLRALRSAHPEVRLFCSHDPHEFDDARGA